jgi:hypothetical protein
MTKPVKFSDTPGPTPSASPTFGQHSDEILSAHGYSAAEIASFREHGVGWPDVCGECRPLRFPPTEHKFILHRTYTGQGCAMCGQPEGAHS